MRGCLPVLCGPLVSVACTRMPGQADHVPVGLYKNTVSICMRVYVLCYSLLSTYSCMAVSGVAWRSG